MANQPAKDSIGIYIRVHKDIKAAIQAEVERINSEVPGANVSVSSWIRAAITEQLKKARKKQ